MDLFPYTYQVTSTNATCAAYEVGEQVEMLVPEPPPQVVVIRSGPCTGTTLTLVAE
jgi:hypothetical protein